MEPSFEIHKAIRARLIAHDPLILIMPEGHILDRNSRPEVFPAIIIGEAQTMPAPGLARDRHEVFADLHLWAKEPGLATVKTIAGLIRVALKSRLIVTGFHAADALVQSTRFLRDPDGIHAHGVLTIRAELKELA